MTTYIPITLVGFGVAGQLLLSHILEIVPAYKIAIVDPDFIGGSLAREYRTIQTNTTIGQKVTSLSTMPPIWSETISALKQRGGTTDCLPVSSLVADIRTVAHTMAAKCVQLYGEIQEASWDKDEKKWSLYFKHSNVLYTTSILCICTGMIPRQEDYGIPIIPLHIALDPIALKQTISPGQSIVVVGSAHSGTLILKHLNTLPTIQVTCIYKGSTPFKFARDGQYGGIKQESETIGDAIMNGEYTNLRLVSLNDTHAIAKAFRSCTWIIQATGFKATIPPLFVKGREPLNVSWDPATGLSEAPQAQTFGACVPSTTTVDGKAYPDISVGSFVCQMGVRWPLLKRQIQDINLI